MLLDFIKRLLRKFRKIAKHSLSVLKRVPCPVCSSFRTLFTVYNGNDDLYKCRSCQTFFVFPPLSPKQIQELYDKKYLLENRKSINVDNFEDDSQWVLWQKLREGFLMSLDLCCLEKSITGRTPAVLEIGCAEGRQLEIFKKRGWKTIGLEVNKYAVEQARKLVGPHVFHGTTLQDIPADLFPVDCIIMSHLIEHVTDPRELLVQCYDALRPEGRIFIETPVPPHSFDDIYHMFLFNENSLQLLLHQAKFSIVNSLIVSNRLHQFKHIVQAGCKE